MFVDLKPIVGPAAGAAVARGATVSLPHVLTDKSGNQWLIDAAGTFQQQGNVPVYGQSAQLSIEGNTPEGQANGATVDARTGEIVIDGLQVNGLRLTRRLKFNEDEGSLRIVDVFTADQPQQINVTLQSTLNFGVLSGEVVAQPGDAAQPIGWAAMTHGNRAAMDWYGQGSRAPVPPTVNWQAGNNVVTATYPLTVARGKPVAIVHLHQTAATQQAATAGVQAIDPKSLLADLPPDVRRALVNVRVAPSLLGDLDLLRGEALDVIELRNGDRVTGTIGNATFALASSFGTFDVPADRVLGGFSIGTVQPRQLLVTTDGQVLGGTLATEAIDVVLAGGQTTAIPLRQVARFGMRLRPGEPDELTADHPFVALRTGDRIAVRPPTAPLRIATRYGELDVPAAAITSVAFQPADASLHVVQLTDGSSLSGLVTAKEIELTQLDGRALKLPIALVSMLMLKADDEPPIATADTPLLRTTGGDRLVGTVGGQLNLGASFGDLSLAASSVRGIARADAISSDVQVTTWDGATISGHLRNEQLPVTLGCGLTLNVPAAMLIDYAQPRPQASANVLEQIRSVVADLNAPDWKRRDQAESQLIAMGPSVAVALRQLRASQPAEVQQRIDSVLKQVADKR